MLKSIINFRLAVLIKLILEPVLTYRASAMTLELGEAQEAGLTLTDANPSRCEVFREFSRNEGPPHCFQGRGFNRRPIIKENGYGDRDYSKHNGYPLEVNIGHNLLQHRNFQARGYANENEQSTQSEEEQTKGVPKLACQPI